MIQSLLCSSVIDVNHDGLIVKWQELVMLLHEAVFSGDVDETRAMLAAGANIDEKDKVNWARMF